MAISLPNSEQVSEILNNSKNRLKQLTVDQPTNVTILAGQTHHLVGVATDNTLASFRDVSEFDALRAMISFTTTQGATLIVESHSGRGTSVFAEEFPFIDVKHVLECIPKTKNVRVSLKNTNSADIVLYNAVVTGIKQPTRQSKSPYIQLTKDLTTSNIVLDVGASYQIIGKASDNTNASFFDSTHIEQMKLIVFLATAGKYKISVEYHSGRGTGVFKKEYTSEQMQYTLDIPRITRYVRVSITNIGTTSFSIQNIIVNNYGGESDSSIKDKDTGEKSTPTTVRDANGRDVLRVVDAAPVAYDMANDKLKVIGEVNVNHDATLNVDYLQSAYAVSLSTASPSLVMTYDLFNNNAKELLASLRFLGTHETFVNFKIEYDQVAEFVRPHIFFEGDSTLASSVFSRITTGSSVSFFGTFKPFARYLRITISLKSGQTTAQIQQALATYIKR